MEYEINFTLKLLKIPFSIIIYIYMLWNAYLSVGNENTFCIHVK